MDGKNSFETITEKRTLCGVQIYEETYSGSNPSLVEQCKRLGVTDAANAEWSLMEKSREK